MLLNIALGAAGMTNRAGGVLASIAVASSTAMFSSLTCAPKAEVLPKGEDAAGAPNAGWDWACPKPAFTAAERQLV